jgi:uncharacterized RDD family membrane protein YckC
MEEVKYVGVTDRVKAVLADSVIIIIMMYGVTLLFSLFEQAPDTAKKIAFIFIFILYEPLFVSLFGGSIGHMMFEIRVKRSDKIERNVLFPIAVFRFIVKTTLGWLSLLTVMGNDKRKAIHDFASGSVVISVEKTRKTTAE